MGKNKMKQLDVDVSPPGGDTYPNLILFDSRGPQQQSLKV